MNTSEGKVDKDALSPAQRVGEILSAVGMLLLFSFFIYHQTMNTGFFTDKFGSLEMLCLYGPLALGLCAPGIRASMGRRNPARPYEAATNLFLALGSLWLLIAFPFNYSHLADALPASIRFILAWVTDDLAKIILLLQVIISPISAFVTMGKYFFTRQKTEPSFVRRAL